MLVISHVKLDSQSELLKWTHKSERKTWSERNGCIFPKYEIHEYYHKKIENVKTQMTKQEIHESYHNKIENVKLQMTK